MFHFCDLCNVLFNIFKGFLHKIVICSKIWVFKWVLGQESHPYALCIGVTFQGQNYAHTVYSCHFTCETGEINNSVHLGHALFSIFSFSYRHMIQIVNRKGPIS